MADGFRILDAMLQSSAVELFHSFGIAIAPSTRSKIIPADIDRSVGASITFTGHALSGELVLMVPAEVFALAHTDDPRPYTSPDWTREMANQLLGRLRNRLMKCQVDLRSGLPRSFSGTVSDRERLKKKPLAVYTFRTLRGDVTVILAGIADDQVLVYSGANESASEGDVILF